MSLVQRKYKGDYVVFMIYCTILIYNSFYQVYCCHTVFFSPLPCCKMSRLRSSSKKILTCLEALDAGYSFINTCSGCDYYKVNRALNLKAMSSSRVELSKMWQCTMPHTLGNLYHCQEHNNPYRETPISKHNSYICNLWEKGGRKSSNVSTNQGNISSSSRHQKKCRITDDDLRDVRERTVASLPLEECAANLASVEAKLAAAEAKLATAETEIVILKSDSSS